jgi:hypothetical protein
MTLVKSLLRVYISNYTQPKLERTTKTCPKPLFYTLFGEEDVGLARGPVRGFSEWMFRQSDNWNVWKRRPAQFWKGYRRKEPDKEAKS